MSHFFLPPLLLTTDNKSIPTWAGLKSGTYFWQFILTFPFTCEHSSSLNIIPSWLKGQGKQASLFCCIALAWARLPTGCSSRGQSPGQKQGWPAPALPALPAAAARGSLQTQPQGQGSSVTLSCTPHSKESRRARSSHLPSHDLKAGMSLRALWSRLGLLLPWNQPSIAFLSIACIVAVRDSSVSTPHQICTGSSPEKV